VHRLEDGTTAAARNLATERVAAIDNVTDFGICEKLHVLGVSWGELGVCPLNTDRLGQSPRGELKFTTKVRLRRGLSGTSIPDNSGVGPMSRDADDTLVAVSPRHSVRLEPEYAAWVARAPRQDFVVRTITRREANGLPLMSADIVIAGEETRTRFQLAAQYPLHFRKTYYPGRLHGDPKTEFERQSEASKILGLPPPIGHTSSVFRSCLLPGTPYNRLSPFGNEPFESNVPIARKLHLATAAGLWMLLEQAFRSLRTLQAAGLSHGDAELHNLIVCPAPLEALLIDFEAAVRREDVSEVAWERRCAADYEPILREAIFLECALGRQPGELAQLAIDRLDQLFKNAGRFRQEIGDQTAPLA